MARKRTSTKKGAAAKKSTKKATGKKASKKKASKKKASKKKASKQSRRKAPATKKKRQPGEHDGPDETEVWAAYRRAGWNKSEAARALGVDEWYVRRILQRDAGREEAIKREIQAQLADEWADTERRALKNVKGTVRLTEGWIAEIEQAAAEGRLTQIRDKDQFCMTVLDATQQAFALKMQDQNLKVASQARTFQTAYRTAQADAEGDRAGGTRPVEQMDEIEIVKMVEASETSELPPILREKFKRIRQAEARAQRKQASDAEAGGGGEDTAG